MTAPGTDAVYIIVVFRFDGYSAAGTGKRMFVLFLRRIFPLAGRIGMRFRTGIQCFAAGITGSGIFVFRNGISTVCGRGGTVRTAGFPAAYGADAVYHCVGYPAGFLPSGQIRAAGITVRHELMSGFSRRYS